MSESIKYDNSPFYYEATFQEDVVIVPANTTLLRGTLLGEIKNSGKLAKFDKTKTDGSEIPVAFLNKDQINNTNNPIEVSTTVIIWGKLNENKLPEDTKSAINETIANLGKVRTILKNNGLIVLSSQELTKYF